MSKNKLAIPRLMHFVAMLKQNKYPNHPKLVEEMKKIDIAGAYSISQKTLQRDVDFLRGDYGAPIKYDYKKRGYYLSDSTWTWSIPQLNNEALDSAIIATHLAESLMPAPLGKRAQCVIDMLVASASKKLLNSDMLVRLVSRGAEIPVNPEIFLTVFDGWVSHKVLIINYTRVLDGENSQLTIEPQILAFYEGCWYLRVKLLKSTNPLFSEKNIITIALHRINKVIPTAMLFEPCKQMIGDANAQKVFDLPVVEEVKIRLRGIGLRYAMERFCLERIKRTSADDVVAYIRNVPEYKIANFVFAWPGDVCILEPEALRKHIAKISNTVFNIHILDN